MGKEGDTGLCPGVCINTPDSGQSHLCVPENSHQIFIFFSSLKEFPCPESLGMCRTLKEHSQTLLLIPYNSNIQRLSSYFQLPRSLGKHCGKTQHHTLTHAHARRGRRDCAPWLQADLLEEVPLASGREGHLPARGQRQLVRHIVGLLAEVRVLLRCTARSARAGAQLQGRRR